MAAGTTGILARGGAWRAWAHLIALTLLAGVVDAVLQLSSGGVTSLGGALARLPNLYFGILPALVAISAGMLTFGPGVTRHATIMVIATTALMLALDPIGSRTLTGATSSFTAVVQPGWVQSGTTGDFTSAPLIGTVWSFLHGTIPLPLPRAQRYEAHAPLVQVVFAILKGAHLLLPAALVGMIMGVQTWVADHVVFRRPVDERVARIVLAWVFAPAGFYVDLVWSRRLTFGVLFQNASPMVPVLPTAVLLVIGAVGWATARRVAQWAS